MMLPDEKAEAAAWSRDITISNATFILAILLVIGVGVGLLYSAAHALFG